MAKKIVVALRVPFAVAILLACAACGGGDGSGALAVPNATAGGQVGPILRPCEATGPSAPPCPASQAAGGK